jgi:hypothetical protein
MSIFIYANTTNPFCAEAHIHRKILKEKILEDPGQRKRKRTFKCKAVIY